jgi:hypothetical protein
MYLLTPTTQHSSPLLVFELPAAEHEPLLVRGWK